MTFVQKSSEVKCEMLSLKKQLFGQFHGENIEYHQAYALNDLVFFKNLFHKGLKEKVQCKKSQK